MKPCEIYTYKATAQIKVRLHFCSALPGRSAQLPSPALACRLLGPDGSTEAGNIGPRSVLGGGSKNHPCRSGL